MMQLEVIPVHALVTVGPIEGCVLRVEIGPGEVRYYVGYWDGKSFKECWFDAALVKSASEKQRIGFQP